MVSVEPPEAAEGVEEAAMSFFCSDGLLGRVETEKGCAAIVREQPSDL